MRPRPDAAENMPPRHPNCRCVVSFNEAAARCRGKQVVETHANRVTFLASMRPRPDAAENADEDALGRVRHAASMRPRPDAAENA